MTTEVMLSPSTSAATSLCLPARPADPFTQSGAVAGQTSSTPDAKVENSASLATQDVASGLKQIGRLAESVAVHFKQAVQEPAPASSKNIWTLKRFL